MLSHDQVLRFHADGFLTGLDAFAPAEAEENRRTYAQISEQVGGDGYAINGYHTSCRGIARMVLHPALLAAVEALIGPEFIAWGTHFFCKGAGDERRVSWHQDGPYWPLTPGTVTAWVAIDDADAGNGAMRLIPGSHRHGILHARDSAESERNVLWRTLDGIERLGEPMTNVLRAGQFSLHHDLMVHGSEPNRSARRRCGLTIRYAPITVRAADPGWAANALRCRGSAPAPHWICHPPPTDGAPIRRTAVIGGN